MLHDLSFHDSQDQLTIMASVTSFLLQDVDGGNWLRLVFHNGKIHYERNITKLSVWPTTIHLLGETE